VRGGGLGERLRNVSRETPELLQGTSNRAVLRRCGFHERPRNASRETPELLQGTSNRNVLRRCGLDDRPRNTSWESPEFSQVPRYRNVWPALWFAVQPENESRESPGFPQVPRFWNVCRRCCLRRNWRTKAGKARSFHKSRGTGMFGGVAACIKDRGTKARKTRSFSASRTPRDQIINNMPIGVIFTLYDGYNNVKETWQLQRDTKSDIKTPCLNMAK